MLQSSTNETCPPDPVGQTLKDILSYLTEVVRLDDRQVNDRQASFQRVVLRQNELDGLPGVACDTRDEDGAVWLSVERLRELGPPTPDPDLSLWIDVSQDPQQRPRIRDSVVMTVESAEKQRLVATAHARTEDCMPALTGPEGASGIWNVQLRLVDRPDLACRIERFIAEPWASWVEAERPRRRTMLLYQRLLDIVDLTRTAGVDRPLELVWGIGILPSLEIERPLLERLVEIEVMESRNGEIRIRPRLVAAGADLTALASLSLPARLIDEITSRVLEAIERNGDISPFARHSFEPILNQISLQLEPPCVDLPIEGSAGYHRLAVSQMPAISDCWMIFARPRSNTLAVRELDRLKDLIDRTPSRERPPAELARVLVLGPSEAGTGNPRRALPSVIGCPIAVASAEDLAHHSDRFFPLPFDNNQIEIVRSLEKAGGLAVRSSSWTRAIPAIANVVCHHLALGQRVLVVARQATPLAELRLHLPAAIRDLAVGQTASDKELSRQITATIGRLQSIAETLSAPEQLAVIDELDRDASATRRQIADLDDEVVNIARANLRSLSGFADLPLDLAKALVAEPETHSWFEDRPEQLLAETGLSIAAVDAVRDARARVEKQLSHLDEELPTLAELPHAEAVAGLHLDLRWAVEEASTEAAEDQWARQAIVALGVEGAKNLSADLESLSAAYRLLADEAWIAPLSSLGKRGGGNVVDVEAIVDLARDASFQLSRHAGFSARPVEVPADALLDNGLIDAVNRLSDQRPAFSRLSLGKANLKSAINAIRVNGIAPSSRDDWIHVRDYLMWRRDIHALNARWSSLAIELGAAVIDGEFAQIVHNLQRLETCVEVAVAVPVIAAQNVAATASSKLARSRAEIEAVLSDGQKLHALGAAIKSAAARLETARRELARLNKLFAGSGGVAASIRNELLTRIGKEQVGADQLRADWVNVRRQIGALDAHREDFALIRTVSEALAQAGAPRLAQRIRTEPANAATGDEVLLTDWPLAWNSAVLTRRLESAGQQPRLRTLDAERRNLGAKLLRLLDASVAARTHLALARTMTGAIKQALTDFVVTLQKTGLTTGDAIGRRDIAPESLEVIYQAIPCWIMPTWQLAEQPHEIGAFDLAIIQEAPHWDAGDLAALLRGQKVLVVSDGAARSPAGDFDNRTVEWLEKRFLRAVPKTIRPFLLPGSSLYDLVNVMFPHQPIDLDEGVRRAEATSRLPAVDPDATTNEQSDPPAADVRMVGGRRATPAKSVQGEADSLIEDGAKARTMGSAAIAAGTLDVRSLDAAPAERSALGLTDAFRSSMEGSAGAPADIAVNPSTKLEPPASRRRPSSAIAGAPAQPEIVAAAMDEAFEGRGTRAIGGEKHNGAARSSRPPSAPGRGDPVSESDVSGRLASRDPGHAREDVARPRRSINALAATLGTASVIAALSMFIALAVAVSGLFAPHSNSDVGSAAPPSPPSSAPSGQPKISDRIAQSQPPAVTGDQGNASEVTPVALPAVLYEEDPADPNGKRYSGTVTWRADTASSGPGVATDTVVKADLEIPERRMSLAMAFRRNTDQTLSATHVFELRFDVPSEPPHGEISKVQGLALKQAEKLRGTLLAGQSAKVTPGYFLVTLSPSQSDMQRNLKLLKEQPWFDIMFLYNNGNRAILALEKGPPGEHAFAQAFGAWGQ